jgi:hypothetical protein
MSGFGPSTGLPNCGLTSIHMGDRNCGATRCANNFFDGMSKKALSGRRDLRAVGRAGSGDPRTAGRCTSVVELAQEEGQVELVQNRLNAEKSPMLVNLSMLLIK